MLDTLVKARYKIINMGCVSTQSLGIKGNETVSGYW